MTAKAEIAARLTEARIAAGFQSGSEAANRHGWSVATYNQHENGIRGLRQHVAQQYAKAFGVSAAWIMYGTGTAPGASAPLPIGFAEPEVSPLDTAPRDLKAMLRQVARAVAPGKTHTAYQVMNRTRVDLLLAKGDILILDLGPRADDGDIVMVQVYDTTGDAETQLRQVLGGQLIGGHDSDPRSIPIDSNSVSIRARVMSSVRPG